MLSLCCIRVVSQVVPSHMSMHAKLRIVRNNAGYYFCFQIGCLRGVKGTPSLPKMHQESHCPSADGAWDVVIRCPSQMRSSRC